MKTDFRIIGEATLPQYGIIADESITKQAIKTEALQKLASAIGPGTYTLRVIEEEKPTARGTSIRVIIDVTETEEQHGKAARKSK